MEDSNQLESLIRTVIQPECNGIKYSRNRVSLTSFFSPSTIQPYLILMCFLRFFLSDFASFLVYLGGKKRDFDSFVFII